MVFQRERSSSPAKRTRARWAVPWSSSWTPYGEAIWQEQKNNGSFAAYIAEMRDNEPSNVDAQVLRTNLADVMGRLEPV